MTNLTKITDWAKSLGISRQQGYAAITRCGIPVQDGRVDPEHATILYRRHTRVRAGKQAAGGSPAQENSALSAAQGAGDSAAAAVTYESSRARREAAEAEISERRLAEMDGKYLVKDDVAAAAFEIARGLRDGLTNCARRIAADVAPLADAASCEEVIEREHRALLETLSHSFAEQIGVVLEEHAE